MIKCKVIFLILSFIKHRYCQNFSSSKGYINTYYCTYKCTHAHTYLCIYTYNKYLVCLFKLLSKRKSLASNCQGQV